VPCPIGKSHESHVSRIGAILILDDPALSLNAVNHNKKSASVQQADCPTSFNPISPQQKTCSSTTKNQLVCSNLYVVHLSSISTIGHQNDDSISVYQ